MQEISTRSAVTFIHVFAAGTECGDHYATPRHNAKLLSVCINGSTFGMHTVSSLAGIIDAGYALIVRVQHRSSHHAQVRILLLPANDHFA
jgi:hypothetical protein